MNMIKIVKIKGGLGNQMFQYAFLKNLKLDYHVENVHVDLSEFAHSKIHNGYELYKIFGLELDESSIKTTRRFALDSNYMPHKFLIKLGVKRKTHCIEKEEWKFRFVPEVLKGNNTIFFDGYWQSYRYFENASSHLKDDFKFKHFIKEENTTISTLISKTDSVSIHIRRGIMFRIHFLEAYAN